MTAMSPFAFALKRALNERSASAEGAATRYSVTAPVSRTNSERLRSDTGTGPYLDSAINDLRESARVCAMLLRGGRRMGIRPERGSDVPGGRRRRTGSMTRTDP